MSDEKFLAIAPGRLTIFGEHSDYLGLDVIPSAIDLAIKMDVRRTTDDIIMIRYPDIQKEDSFAVDGPLEYRGDRDYVRAAFNVLRRIGIVPKTGAEVEVTSNIPIGAGLSSSSALTVATILMISQLAERTMHKKAIVEMAFRAEVGEFGESGGIQDHIASVFGGLLHLDVERRNVVPLPAKIEGLVIGDSNEKKTDTVGDIKRIHEFVTEGYRALREAIPEFSRRTTPIGDIIEHIDSIPKRYRKMTLATIKNRDLTARAFALLRSPTPNPEIVGRMIDEHHAILRDGLDRSTSKIEHMIEAAKKVGALGCKINGSGGGGTVLAYAPGREDLVMEAIREAGGAPYRVKIGRGASIVR